MINPEITVEDRHYAAARAYDTQWKPVHSWAPVWDGTKFVMHAWAPDPFHCSVERRLSTACELAAPFPSTWVVNGSEPRCEKCWDVTLVVLATAFAKAELEISHPSDLSPNEWKALGDMIDDPPAPTEALVKLMSQSEPHEGWGVFRKGMLVPGMTGTEKQCKDWSMYISNFPGQFEARPIESK